VHSKYLLPVLCNAIINSLDPSGPCGPDQLTDSHQRTWILMHRQLVRHPLAFEDMQCLNRQPIGYPMSRPSVFWPFWQDLALCQLVVPCHDRSSYTAVNLAHLRITCHSTARTRSRRTNDAASYRLWIDPRASHLGDDVRPSSIWCRFDPAVCQSNNLPCR
jgi:hypothetical protein